jgi:hypothetical protein
MQNLKSLYKETKEKFDSLEKKLIDCYIAFLREVARFYLRQGRRVFFEENRFVHWGEGNFGWLVIEGEEETDEVFSEYISEIKFEPKISKKTLSSYMEIKEDNLKDIKYVIR